MKPSLILLAAASLATARPHEKIEARQLSGLPALDAFAGMDMGKMMETLKEIDYDALMKSLDPQKLMKMLSQYIDINKMMDNPMVKSMGNMAIDMAMGMMPKIQLSKIIHQKSDLKAPGVKRLELWSQPIKLLLPADARKAGTFGKMDPNSNTVTGSISNMPTDITILKAKTELKYADGSLATVTSGVYNHHVFYANMKKSVTSPYMCNELKTAGSGIPPIPVFTGAGEEAGSGQYTNTDGSFPSGFYLAKDAKIMYGTEIVNYGNSTKEVFAVTQFDYVEGKPKGFMDAGFAVLSVTQCDGTSPMLRPPPGQKKYNYKSKMLTLTQDGYVVMVRGHLHDGGVNIVMQLNGKQICDSRAVYGSATTDVEGNKWMAMNDMTYCNEPIKVTKGDQIQIEAFYDLEKYPARKHAHGGSAEGGHGSMGGMGGGEAEEMGIMSFSFAAADSKNA